MDEKLIRHVAENVVNDYKQELMEKFDQSLQELKKEKKEELINAIKQKVHEIKIRKNQKLLDQIEQEHNERIVSFLSNRRNLKNDLESSCEQEITGTRSEMLESNATEYIENNTEGLELSLWNEMSATLQEAYRLNRNTASQLKVKKQLSIDNAESRLESKFLEMKKIGINRLQYLKSSMNGTLEEELKIRTEKMKLNIELEMKTFRRELDQLKQNAEANQAISSVVCNLL